MEHGNGDIKYGTFLSLKKKKKKEITLWDNMGELGILLHKWNKPGTGKTM